MTIWPELPGTDSLPPTLFHYTTRQGLLGILDSRQLWATSSQFLNDPSELRYSTGIISEVADGLKAHANSDFRSRLLHDAGTLHLDAAIQFKKRVFLFSFSEDGDLLSQWRAYGRPRDAYSLGIDSLTLRTHCADMGIHLAKCVYEPCLQREMVRNAMIRALDEFDAHRFPPDSADGAVYAAMTKVHLTYALVAALLKNPAYVDEREWRMVMLMDDRDVEFRSGPNGINPYVKIEIRPDLRLLKEVVVGPTANGEAEVAALNWYLNEKAFGAPTVRTSIVPYRL